MTEKDGFTIGGIYSFNESGQYPTWNYRINNHNPIKVYLSPKDLILCIDKISENSLSWQHAIFVTKDKTTNEPIEVSVPDHFVRRFKKHA